MHIGGSPTDFGKRKLACFLHSAQRIAGNCGDFSSKSVIRLQTSAITKIVGGIPMVHITLSRYSRSSSLVNSDTGFPLTNWLICPLPISQHPIVNDSIHIWNAPHPSSLSAARITFFAAFTNASTAQALIDRRSISAAWRMSLFSSTEIRMPCVTKPSFLFEWRSGRGLREGPLPFLVVMTA